jgi:type III restriction enzyme
MTYILKDYQEEIVHDTLLELDTASARYVSGERRTAVGIAAPTGSGKTVVASAVIEELFFGSEAREPNRDLTILWITDDGDLNEQSKLKIAQASDRVTNSQMLTVDASFDQRTFDRGFIYFLNVQKLGDGASRHVRVGEGRRFSIWESIGNTVAERGQDFVVIIDEAHRGSGDNAKPTILRTIIDGGSIAIKNAEGTVVRTIVNKPAPIVLGISATPQKFQDAMSATKSNRSLTTVEADIAKVRASGLIKEHIDVTYSTDDQPTDDSLIRKGVTDLIASDDLWQARRLDTDGRDAVTPLMVIQVPDKTSEKKLAEIVQSLTESWSGFDDLDSIAHSFGDHAERSVDTTVSGVPVGRRIQYVSPLDIAKETKIRAVIFMKALTTGWDCPRAEVMVSLRTAKEFTDIAQLIGRMVRNPLAKAIDGADFAELNAVSLYLPGYDADEVARVISSFKSDENVDSDVRINPVTLSRNPAIPADVWSAAAELTKELKPHRRYRNDVQRLHGLATLLDNEGFESKSGDGFEHEAEQLIIQMMGSEYARLSTSIDTAATDLLVASFGRKRYDQHSGAEISVIESTTAISALNLAALEAEALRVLPEHTASLVVGSLIAGGCSHRSAVARVTAMSRIPDVIRMLVEAASARIEVWRRDNAGNVGRLDAATRSQLQGVWNPVEASVDELLVLPNSIRTKTQVLSEDGLTLVDLPKYRLHLFADVGGYFPEKLNTWEQEVVEVELARPTILGWFRNTTSGLSVVYTDGGADKSLFPDFVFFHRAEDGSVAVDIIDPHNYSYSDSGPKWAALSRYAREHPAGLRRVAAVIKTGDVLQALELNDRGAEFELMLGATSGKNSFEQLFDEQGGVY